jgi:AbrB family looped-hinge helix DNA binding protein
MKIRVSSKDQIVLPAEIRTQDDIKTGQEFDVIRLDPGEYHLKRKDKPQNAGLVRLLLACPAKDWFQPLDRAETTDEIKPPKFG